MRYAAVLGTVTLTELAAHFLSLGWGIMILLAAFAWTALSGATVAAKARSTEDRVNALVPAVGTAYTLASNAFPRTGGTVSGNVTVNGSHTVNGTIAGSQFEGTGGAMENSGGIHSSGVVEADSGVSTSSVNASGGYEGASIHVSGASEADGGFTTGSSFEGGSIHVSGNAEADGSFSAGNFSGSYAGGQGAVTPSTGTLASTASAVNGCISRMQSAGLI